MNHKVATAMALSLLLGSAGLGWAQQKSLDRSRIAVILPFESEVARPGGLPEATRTAVIQILKDEKLFAGVLTPEETKDKDKATMVEISAKLVEFSPGNRAARVLVGMGSGRASARFDFVIKDAGTGDVLWKNSIKKKASVWSNSASSSAQRMELPDQIGETLVKQLRGKNY